MKKFLISLILVTFITLGMMPLPSNAYAQTLTAPSSSTTSSPQGTTLQTVQYTRYSVDSPEGQKALKSLEKALKIMRGSVCSQPDSWYWQGAVHWVPAVKDLPQRNDLCQKYTQATFDDPAQKAEVERLIIAWQHCTHNLTSSQNPSPHVTLTEEFYGHHFLPWHRLYLAYFEKIVRKLSGDDLFAIPYWDYTRQPTVPTEFVNSASSLYEGLRDPVINVTKKVDSIKQQQIQKDKISAYESTAFNSLADPNSLGLNFTNKIDGSPHGVMHVYIGGRTNAFNPIWQKPSPSNSGIMRDVTTAGFDPIFWVHHSNIDRYWESWTQATKIKATAKDIPLSQELTQLYTFSDENGIEHTYKTSQEIIDAVYNKVDFKYDSLDKDAGQSAREQPASFLDRSIQPQITDLVGTEQPLHKNINALTTPIAVQLTIPLQADPDLALPNVDPSTRSALPDASSVASLALGQYVLEVQVSYENRPSRNYSVYLDLSPLTGSFTSTITDIKNFYVGAANFFDVHSSETGTKTFAFDVTDELNAQFPALGLSALNNFNLLFVSDDGSSSSDVFVEKIALRKLA